jgi:SAM-dependent methyltransferase
MAAHQENPDRIPVEGGGPRTIPLPPAEFAHRVGCIPAPDCMKRYVGLGARIRAEIDAMLPSDWTWEGKRVLDFGCGAGRVLRHFVSEAEVAEFHGSDIDPEMIAWLQANLCPPLAGANVNRPAPPLPYPESSFDLVIATSVFTHIVDEWSSWLLEMHRILKPDGLLLATFLGRGMSEVIAGDEDWDPNRIGMNPFNLGGGAPDVLHSEWWLREHWGRAFDFLEFRPEGFAAGKQPGVGGHGCVLMRPRPVSLAREDLERERPGDDRYAAARSHHLEQVRAGRRSRGSLARRIQRAVRARTRR